MYCVYLRALASRHFCVTDMNDRKQHFYNPFNLIANPLDLTDLYRNLFVAPIMSIDLFIHHPLLFV